MIVEGMRSWVQDNMYVSSDNIARVAQTVNDDLIERVDRVLSDMPQGMSIRPLVDALRKYANQRHWSSGPGMHPAQRVYSADTTGLGGYGDARRALDEWLKDVEQG